MFNSYGLLQHLGFNGSADDALLTQLILNGIGITDYTEQTMAEKVENLNMNKFPNVSQELLEKYAEGEFSKLTSGKYQTQKTLSSVTMENLTTDLATMYQDLGLYGDNIISAIENLGNIIISGIVSSVVGKGIGALAGSAAGGVGSGMLATGGGILLGAVAGVALTSILEAVASGDVKKTVGEAHKELYDTQSELAGNSAAEIVIGASKTTNAIDWENGNPLGNFFATVGGGIAGGGRSIAELWSDDKGDNEGRYKNLKISMDQSDNSLDKDERAAKMLAWLLLADYGNGSSVLGDIGVTHKDLVKYLQSEQSPSVYTAMSYFGTKGFYSWQPKDHFGNQITELSNTYLEALKKEVGENFHRYGLDEVPYDEYPAMLHEGEAVLTASTANELRNLLDEYRSNSQSIAVLDATIQSQTTTLVGKLDEVISAINTNALPLTSSTANTDQGKARGRLLNSMTHMINTKDGLS